MSLIRWNPFREMDELHQRLNTLLANSAARPVNTANGEEQLAVSAWTPLVDITEDDHSYLIKAELPEVLKSDLSVKVQDGVLSISGERKFEKEDKGKRYHRIERAYGHFSRTFTLPDDADDQKVTAEFKDGVLVVNVAKAEKAKPRQVDVKVN